MYWARFVALQRGVTENAEATSGLVLQARQHLQAARHLCETYPGQAEGMNSEVEEVEKMLRDSTFYATVSLSTAFRDEIMG